jgi:hypothetical protein
MNPIIVAGTQRVPLAQMDLCLRFQQAYLEQMSPMIAYIVQLMAAIHGKGLLGSHILSGVTLPLILAVVLGMAGFIFTELGQPASPVCTVRIFDQI